PLTVGAWLCRSTNPGVTTHPAASRTVRPRRLGPIAATRVSSIATSAAMSTPWLGSITRPPRITRGNSTVCSRSGGFAVATPQPDRPAAAHPSRKLRRSSVSASGLEDLNRVTRGVIDDDLGATRSTHDVLRAKRHTGAAQSRYLCLEIRHCEVNSV